MRAKACLTLLALLAACQAQQPQIPRTWELPAGVKVARVNGYDMAFVERGSGVPVIFVHGAGVDYRFFAAQMEPFSERFRAISVSLRHYYPEPWRGQGDFSLNQQASDLVAFVHQLGVGPVHLVGHSRGATVALYATLAAPGLVRSLTFAEGGRMMKAFETQDPAVRERSAASRATMLEKLKAGDLDGGLEIFSANVNGPGAWRSTPEQIKQSLRDNAWTLVAGATDQDRWTPLGCEDAKRLDVPVLLLGAQRSAPGYRAVLDRIQPCLRRAERRMVMNSGHPMPEMNPAGFTSEVLAFITNY